MVKTGAPLRVFGRATVLRSLELIDVDCPRIVEEQGVRTVGHTAWGDSPAASAEAAQNLTWCAGSSV